VAGSTAGAFMKKILAIGLKKEILGGIEGSLRPLDFTVIGTGTVKEALALIKKNKFTLLLLSNKLPDLENYREFCLLIKSQNETSNIPIILFADVKEKSNAKIEVLKTGLINDYFLLPTPIEEILARLNIFIELKLLQEELEAKNVLLKKLSITDELTRIYNRRHLMERLAEEVESMRRYRYELSCLMIDIDHFKKINDSFGHQKGDDVLKQLSALIKANIRSVDILGRYGGEEFLALLPFTGKENALAVAERLRTVVKEHNFADTDHPLQFTLSIGAATFANTDPLDVNEVIRVTDEELYRAKHMGRDRVCFALNSHPAK
jgi:two-component system cell cycle response regulator